MGSSESFKKDQNVDIYMELTKPIYTAGQNVEGCVYLNIKAHSAYDALYIRLEGHEHVYWTQGSGKNRRTYRNNRQTYKQQFILNTFPGQIALGHYSFPFSFTLPHQLTGTFFISDNNYIKFMLSSYLTSHQGKHDNQSFQINLNILQPMRSEIGMAKTQRTVNSKCCGCCIDYGRTTISMTSNTNCAMTGDQIKVSAIIDNTLGSNQIDNVIFSLYQRKIMISSSGRTTQRGSQHFPLFSTVDQLRKTIKAGTTENVAFSAIIPTNIVLSTAVGNITAIWYELIATSSLGCCNYSPPTATINIFLHSRTPKILQKLKINPPLNWNPYPAAMIIYNNMKPFNYQPHQQIITKLAASIAPIIKNNMGFNEGTQPNFGKFVNNTNFNLTEQALNGQIYKNNGKNFYNFNIPQENPSYLMNNNPNNQMKEEQRKYF